MADNPTRIIRLKEVAARTGYSASAIYRFVQETTLAIGLIASVISGGVWPDRCLVTEKQNAVIWSAEDGSADTLVPRLIAAGADLDQVFFLDGRTNSLGESDVFAPAQHFASLRSAVKEAVRLMDNRAVDSDGSTSEPRVVITAYTSSNDCSLIVSIHEYTRDKVRLPAPLYRKPALYKSQPSGLTATYTPLIRLNDTTGYRRIRMISERRLHRRK